MGENTRANAGKTQARGQGSLSVEAEAPMFDVSSTSCLFPINAEPIPYRAYQQPGIWS